jgi:hypothetical protein
MGRKSPWLSLSHIKLSILFHNLYMYVASMYKGDKEMEEAHNRVWEFPHTSIDSDENKSGE